FKNQKVSSVLDYGTGKMRNAVYLSGEGFRIYAVDLPEQLEKLKGSPSLASVERLLSTDDLAHSGLAVDLVLSTYVFNIISTPQGRADYLSNAVSALRQGGYLLMEVRCRRLGDACEENCPNRLVDGSCPKALSHEELDHFLEPYGLRRVSHYYRNHSIAAVYRKQAGTGFH
ncbi:MAG TPA: class I SAM-dependent methyltransferase, partial [Candidatus Deferrimicrobiaceae bacterium]